MPPLENHAPAAPSSISIGDIYFVVFRHKWKIILMAILGFVAAAFLYVRTPPSYQSTAKLLLRYVTDSRALVPAGADRSQVRSPDERGANIINSELEILTSRDLAHEVVDIVGAQVILAELGGGTDTNKAAAALVRGIIPDVPRKSSVISVTYQHPNPQTARTVLRALVERYLEKHITVHRATGTFDFLEQQTDQLGNRLKQTEEDLRNVKTQAGVTSIADAKKLITEQLASLNRALYEAQAELAERTAKVTQLQSASSVTNAPGVAPAPAADASEHKEMVERLSTLRKRELELASQFTGENTLLKQVRRQIAEAETERRDWEVRNPKVVPTEDGTGNGRAVAAIQEMDLAGEKTRVVALEARIKQLTEQLKKSRDEAAKIDAAETTIVQLERRKELEESNYKYFSASLEQARIDDALDSGKISNISIVQAPSLPARNTDKLFKSMMIAIVGGVAGGLALAFLTDYFIDLSVKRPREIEKLGIPLLVSIPYLPAARPRPWKGSPPHASGKNNKKCPPPPNGDHEEHQSEMRFRSHFGNLRDRVVLGFKSESPLTKTIGITSCRRGAGSSMVAEGLAVALSQETERDVLLIRVNDNEIGWSNFNRGQAAAVNDADSTIAHRQPLHNELSVLSANSISNGHPAKVSIARSFSSLMPQLQTSNYEYILFDLPPVTETSATMRLGETMDQVLLVIEAEANHRELAQRASRLLLGGKARISAVLNKKRQHTPPWLHSEV